MLKLFKREDKGPIYTEIFETVSPQFENLLLVLPPGFARVINKLISNFVVVIEI